MDYPVRIADDFFVLLKNEDDITNLILSYKKARIKRSFISAYESSLLDTGIMRLTASGTPSSAIISVQADQVGPAPSIISPPIIGAHAVYSDVLQLVGNTRIAHLIPEFVNWCSENKLACFISGISWEQIKRVMPNLYTNHSLIFIPSFIEGIAKMDNVFDILREAKNVFIVLGFKDLFRSLGGPNGLVFGHAPDLLPRIGFASLRPILQPDDIDKYFNIEFLESAYDGINSSRIGETISPALFEKLPKFS